MLKFFKRIRQRLLVENRISRYLLYAVGEIVLVVIGILIALQINNWNEERKQDKQARAYVSGIKSDLEKDLVLLDSIIGMLSNDISLINSLDTIFKKEQYNPSRYYSFFLTPDTTKVHWLFYRGLSFRPIQSSYKSMIADGKSGLIRDPELLADIREIYDERHTRIASVYETFKPTEDRIRWLYPKERRNWSYADLKAAKNEQIFLDLLNFSEIKYFHNQGLFNLKEHMLATIARIEEYLRE